MDNPGTSLIHPSSPPYIQPLNQSDLTLIERVREELVQRGINPPSWREADSEKRRRFYDEVRSILIDQGENRSVDPVEDINRTKGFSKVLSSH